jgi:flagellar export protein FliJ
VLNPLNTLIKVTKFQLEEKRKLLNELLNHKEAFINNIKALEEELKAEEQKKETLGIEFQTMFPYFILLVRAKQQKILDDIENLNPLIKQVNDELFEIFTENKKFQILKDRKTEELAYEKNKQTQLELDEISLIKFIRKND